MITYKIKLVSQPHSILFGIVILIAIFTEVEVFFPNGLHNYVLSFLLVLVEVVPAVFLWRWLVTGRTEWDVDNNQITIKWIKRFPFSQLPDYSVEVKDVERIWQGMDRQYYALKIERRTEETITFYHDPLARDDFKKLLQVLQHTFPGAKLGL